MENNEKEFGVSYMVGAPDNVISVLEQFSTSAEGIAKFSHLVITEVEEGRIDPLKVALFMKTMEKIKERVNERLHKYYVSEAGKYGEKPFDHLGAEISVGEVGGRFQFTGCHPEWDGLQRIIDSALEQQAPLEALVKALKTPTDIRIEDELVTLKPPVKVGAKMSIKIKIK